MHRGCLSKFSLVLKSSPDVGKMTLTMTTYLIARLFRLCIYDDEREKLIDWPNSVKISPWYFKSPDTRETGILPHSRNRGNDDATAA